MAHYTLLAACIALLGTAWAQQYTTPVPILKQINRHNDDGSYSYGYEAADGSFKIETKYNTGEVYGKYGYVDDTGKVREVEYGASRRGFEPAGNDINVPPPTLSQNPQANTPLADGQEDDGQYREDPSVYFKDDKYNRPAQQPAYRPQEYQQKTYRPQPQPQAQPQPQYTQTQYTTQYQQPKYQQPQYQQPQYQQPQYQQPQYQQYQQPQYQAPAHRFDLNPSQFATHPAVRNIDYFSGSYSIDYSGKKK